MSVNKKRINDYITARGGFTMVPNELWELNINTTAKAIWCYIFSRKASWQSSQNNVARNLKLHANTVAKHVPKLVELNMLKITKGTNNAFDYEIIPPNEWLTSATVIKPDSGEPKGAHHKNQHTVPQKSAARRHKNHSIQKKIKSSEGELNFTSDQTLEFQDKRNITPEEANIYDAPENLVRPSFEDIVYQLDITLDKLKSAEKEDTLEVLVNTCKDHGLTRDQLSPSRLVKIAMISLRDTPKNNGWKEDIAICFNRAIAIAYAPKITPSNTAEEKQYEIEQRYKRFKAGQVTKGPSWLDSPEFAKFDKEFWDKYKGMSYEEIEAAIAAEEGQE